MLGCPKTDITVYHTLTGRFCFEKKRVWSVSLSFPSSGHRAKLVHQSPAVNSLQDFPPVVVPEAENTKEINLYAQATSINPYTFYRVKIILMAFLCIIISSLCCTPRKMDCYLLAGDRKGFLPNHQIIYGVYGLLLKWSSTTYNVSGWIGTIQPQV